MIFIKKRCNFSQSNYILHFDFRFDTRFFFKAFDIVVAFDRYATPSTFEKLSLEIGILPDHRDFNWLFKTEPDSLR